MTTTVYMFRHGQTDWNKMGRLQGHTDIPLNQTGIEQAKEVAHIIEPIHFDHAYSSDLSRAFESTQIATKNHTCKITTHKELRESFLGEAEGIFKNDIKTKFGFDIFEEWLSEDKSKRDLSYPGGESIQSMIDRVTGFINSKTLGHKDTNILIGTHGAVIGHTICFANNYKDHGPRVENCHIHKFRIKDSKWTHVGRVLASEIITE